MIGRMEEVQLIRARCDPKFDAIFQQERHIRNPLARDVIGGHDNWSQGRETYV
eukprot:SAG11_NODE_968_length_6354_cov_16.546922_8_plen_53_part_00